MTYPSEKPPIIVHSGEDIEDLKRNLASDHESLRPACAFNSQAPGNKIPLADAIRDIRIATQRVPKVIIPEDSDEESDETDDGPEAA